MTLKRFSGKKVKCLGRGQQAEWRKAGEWELGNNH